jgi:hypothetical protein
MMLKKLVENVAGAVNNDDAKSIIAEGAYNSNEDFRHLYGNGTEAVIKARKNLSTDKFLTNCYPREICCTTQQLKKIKILHSPLFYYTSIFHLKPYHF